MGKENTFKFLTQNNFAGICIFEGQEEGQEEFKGVAEIKLNELESLDGLMLNDNNLSDISSLKELKGLVWLSLDNNQLTDISPLKELKKLWQLSIDHNQITDISPLKELKNLQYLHVDSNPVLGDQIEALKQALSGCKIYHDPFR